MQPAQSSFIDAVTDIPRHIAIVMDGNGRWAAARHRPRVMGHRAGLRAVRRIVQACIQRQIPILSLFAFSSENWQRPREEVRLLMTLFMTALKRELAELHKHQVQLRIIGDRSRFSASLQQAIASAEEKTQHNTGLKLIIAANYSGQWDIWQAMYHLAQQVQQGQLPVEHIQPEQIQQSLCLADLPPPDLLIRTSGERRISNFFLWQIAYTELYFTDCLWPDFDEVALDHALADYAGRERRFGLTSEQLPHVCTEKTTTS